MVRVETEKNETKREGDEKKRGEKREEEENKNKKKSEDKERSVIKDLSYPHVPFKKEKKKYFFQ